jgi:chaperonin cofactor prefoldin
VSEATPRDEPGPPGAVAADLDRLEALEDQLRHMASRLAGWVEAQLARSVDDRRAEFDALRAEVLESVEARVSGIPAAGGTPVAVDPGAGAWVEAFEQRVKAAVGRLNDSVETRLAETTTARAAELDALRSAFADRLDRLEREGAATAESLGALLLSSRANAERTAALEEQAKAAVARLEQSVDARTEALVAQVAAANDAVAALQAEAGAGPARADLLEQRVRSAMGRLAESVEARLAEAAAARAGDLASVRADLEAQADDLRTEIETVASAARARASQALDRLDAVEAREREAGDRLEAMVEAKLVEVVERRRAEFDALRRDVEESVALQVSEARTEISTVVADAHRRFVVSVDGLEERMVAVSEQSAAAQAAVARVEAMPEAVVSDGRRIEALEEHTRRTDARLSDLVDAKLAERAADRLAEIAGVRDQLRTSVDAHLADIRAEVAFTLGEGRAEVAAATNRVDEAAATVGALGAALENSLREAERSRADDTQARQYGLAVVAAEAAEGRAELREQLDALAAQVAALAKTAATEGGVLAPLRSDIRLLQEQLAELAETVEGIRPRRKAPAPARTPARRVLPPAPKKAAPRRDQ